MLTQLPEVDLKDQPNGVAIEINAKPEYPNQLLPLIFKAHKDGVKNSWVAEAKSHINDQLALHEHSVDDLRIDPTQIKQDVDDLEEAIKSHRKASYESDGIKPSEVAKDHFLTPEEREYYAKQLAEEQQILELQQQYIQRKCQVSSIEQIEDGLVTQTKVIEQTREEIVQSKGDDKHGKLIRSTAIEQRSEEIQVQSPETKEKEIDRKESLTTVTESKRSPSETAKPKVTFDEQSCTQTKSSVNESVVSKKAIDRKKTVDTGNTVYTVNNELKSLPPAAAVDLHAKVDISTAAIIDANQITLANATNQDIKVHTVENQLALCTTNTSPQDGGGSNQQSQSESKSLTGSPGTGSSGNSQNPSDHFQTISVFTFHDRQGGPPGLPPQPNLPDFLIPRHLITYETSFEFHIRRIPNPPPPPPPRFIKKLLVHTESLERKTRAFLSGNFEVGPTDNSLRTARQKIRSLKSTILKSDDEVKHAEDTIHKAQSGDFIHIFAPPVIEKPSHEFIEIPSERSEEECSEFSDRRSERAISEQAQQENMEDYYSSRYSSRSSRRQVEGKFFFSSLLINGN